MSRLLATLIRAITGGARTAAAGHNDRKRAAAMKQKTTGCVACDSKNVDELAPDAYRCPDCGYEGGDGYAAYQADLWMKEADALDAATKRARARELLTSAEADLAIARDQTVRADEAVRAGGDSDKLPLFLAALRALGEARQGVERAHYLAFGEPTTALADIDLGVDEAAGVSASSLPLGGGALRRRAAQIAADVNGVTAAHAAVSEKLASG